MEKALCDTTLINTSYQSNHSLQIESCKFREYPSGLAYYFQMNKCKNKITVARRKILENISDMILAWGSLMRMSSTYVSYRTYWLGLVSLQIS